MKTMQWSEAGVRKYCIKTMHWSEAGVRKHCMKTMQWSEAGVRKYCMKTMQRSEEKEKEKKKCLFKLKTFDITMSTYIS